MKKLLVVICSALIWGACTKKESNPTTGGGGGGSSPTGTVVYQNADNYRYQIFLDSTNLGKVAPFAYYTASSVPIGYHTLHAIQDTGFVGTPATRIDIVEVTAGNTVVFRFPH